MSDSVIGRGVIEVVADTSKVKAGIDDAKRSVKSLGSEIGNATSEGAARAQRSLDAYIKKLELSASTVGKSAREIKVMELAQRGATEAQLKAADVALKTIEAHRLHQSEARRAAETVRTVAVLTAAAQNSQATATKLNAHQMQQLSFQLNDFFVQVASGQNPMTALIQQGSQLSGTFGGMGGALRAVASVFTTTRVVIGGVVGTIAGLALVAREGSNESIALAKSLALTGNAAGITEGRFNRMAQAIADNTKTTIGSSRETLQALVSSGRFGSDALAETAKATQLMAKVTGESSEDVTKRFSGMADGVAKWAETTNRSYHFLTAEQLKYIKTLEDQGDTQKAIEETMRALNGRLTQAAQHTDSLSKGWFNVKDAISGAKEAMLSFFRETPSEDKIKSIEAAIAAFDARKANPLFSSQSSNPKIRAELVGQLEVQREVIRLQTRSAEQQARDAASTQAKITFGKLQEQNLTKQQKLTKELADANAIADKAGVPQTDRAAVLAGIRERYKELDLSKPTLDLDIKKIEAQLGILTNSYKNAESILEATRSAGMVSEKEYYDEKRKFITQNADAQVIALEKENALLMFQQASGKEAIEIQKKLAENQAKINEIKNDAAAKGTVLDIQQASSIKQVTRSYEEARIAAQDYLSTLTRQQGRDLDAFGMGDKERSRLAGRQQIEDRYNQQRLDLESNKRLLELEGKFTDESRKQYEQRAGIINEFQGKALSEWDQYYANLGDKEAEWTNGASRAVQNYLDGVRNVSKQTESAFTNAFSSMEDAAVKFAMTGKLSIGSMLESIAADFIKMQMRTGIANIAQLIAGAFGPTYNTGGVSLPGSFNPTNHTGGIVGAERTSTRFVRGFPSNAPRYHTGGIAGDEVPTILKRGEGVFTPGQMRNMAPVANSDMGGVSIEVNVDASGSKVEGNNENANELGRMIGNAVRVVLVQEMRPGGLLAS